MSELPGKAHKAGFHTRRLPGSVLRTAGSGAHAPATAYTTDRALRRLEA
jgi:hypothetical protein